MWCFTKSPSHSQSIQSPSYCRFASLSSPTRPSPVAVHHVKWHLQCLGRWLSEARLEKVEAARQWWMWSFYQAISGLLCVCETRSPAGPNALCILVIKLFKLIVMAEDVNKCLCVSLIVEKRNTRIKQRQMLPIGWIDVDASGKLWESNGLIHGSFLCFSWILAADRQEHMKLLI